MTQLALLEPHHRPCYSEGQRVRVGDHVGRVVTVWESSPSKRSRCPPGTYYLVQFPDKTRRCYPWHRVRSVK